MDALFRDLRLALRSLRHTPGAARSQLPGSGDPAHPPFRALSRLR